MSNINNPFRDIGDPQEVKVTEILADKESPSLIQFRDLSLKSEVIMRYYVMQVLKDECEDRLDQRRETYSISEMQFVKSLKELLMLFEALEVEDLSENFDFSHALSTCWHDLISYQESLKKMKQPAEYLGKLNLLIDTIRHYPTESQHSLGYYLQQHIGKEWIPFPYMDMVRTLYEEHLVYKAKSTLAKWLSQIRELLGTFTLGI